MRLPTFNKPRVIACGEELANHIAVPHGCLAEVIELLKSHRIKAEIDDQRFAGIELERSSPANCAHCSRMRLMRSLSTMKESSALPRLLARQLSQHG